MAGVSRTLPASAPAEPPGGTAVSYAPLGAGTAAANSSGDGFGGRRVTTTKGRGDEMLRMRATLLASVAAVLVAVISPAAASAKYSVPYGNAALGDAVWNETWAPESVEGANNNCKPSSAHPYPVVLVHATLADEGSNWVTLAPLLANEGYCVYSFNYGATIASWEVWPFIGPRIDGIGHIERSAEELRSFVNNVLSKTGAAKVDLVGHSQGGMMPNYYIKLLGGA